MDQVPLIDRMSVMMRGAVTSSTICLADLDNDGEFELGLGSSAGHLSVFKGVQEECVRRQTRLGHIVALAAGDVFNRQKNVLVVITADGNCRIFDWDKIPPTENVKDEEENDDTSSSTLNSNGKPANPAPWPPCFHQRLPPNVKQAQIRDVNGDGLNELVVM